MNRISRRAFNAGVAAASLAAGTGALSSNASAQTPKKGGRLRVATPDASSTETLDPAMAVNFTEQFRGFVIYSKLTDTDSDGKLIPQLAESWESNPASTEWTFKLRSGVEFHNGKKLTSADVVYTVKRVADPKTGSGGAGVLRNVAEVKADGPGRVIVTLKSGDAQFPAVMSTRHIAITQEGAALTDAIGTGPWKVKSFQPGMSTLLVRNDTYWESGLPYLDEIESIGIPDATNRVNALLSGEVDLIQGIDSKILPRVKNSGVAQVMSITGASHVTFPMRADMPPFDKPEVRLALKLAFDRQKFVDLAFGGAAEIGRDHPISPTDRFHCASVPVPKADPTRVKELLKKAGHENTVFELITADNALGGANAAIVLGELMRENGVNVQVRRVPSDGYFRTVWKKVPWCASYFSGRPTTAGTFETAYVTGAPDNEANWTSLKLDALVAQARAEKDDKKAAEILCEAQHLLSAEGATIIPCFVPWTDGYANRVKGIKPNPRYALGAGRLQTVWLDK